MRNTRKHPSQIPALAAAAAVLISLFAGAPAPAATKRVSITRGIESCLVPLAELIRAQGIGKPRNLWVEIDKSDRLLRLMSGNTLLKTYVVNLGKNPDARKTRRGDKATPEGWYYVCQKLPRSQFYLSLKLSYPGINDAAAGLRRGLISRGTYTRIENAIRRKQSPPMNTALGGNICIHGEGKAVVGKDGSRRYVDVTDWTAGCVALRRADIRELFHALPVGTRVRIKA